MLIYMMMLETPEEKSKFEQLYLEYKGLMFHVAYEILHNEQDAEDAVHQAFVKIAENIKKIDDPICPKTHSYVVTIVENKAIDLYDCSCRMLPGSSLSAIWLARHEGIPTASLRRGGVTHLPYRTGKKEQGASAYYRTWLHYWVCCRNPVRV